MFFRDTCAGRLFLFACPPRATHFIHLHFEPAPCRQTKIWRRRMWKDVAFLWIDCLSYLTLPRENVDRWFANYCARPGNLYDWTGWNQGEWMALSNNGQISKSWIFSTYFVSFACEAKISKISKIASYWIVFWEIGHTHISVLSNIFCFQKLWICISRSREEFL